MHASPQEHIQYYPPNKDLLTQGFFVPEHFSLATSVDADYIALRAMLNINKMLMNLQRVLIHGLYNF